MIHSFFNKDKLVHSLYVLKLKVNIHRREIYPLLFVKILGIFIFSLNNIKYVTLYSSIVLSLSEDTWTNHSAVYGQCSFYYFLFVSILCILLFIKTALIIVESNKYSH